MGDWFVAVPEILKRHSELIELSCWQWCTLTIFWRKEWPVSSRPAAAAWKMTRRKIIKWPPLRTAASRTFQMHRWLATLPKVNRLQQNHIVFTFPILISDWIQDTLLSGTTVMTINDKCSPLDSVKIQTIPEEVDNVSQNKDEGRKCLFHASLFCLLQLSLIPKYRLALWNWSIKIMR